MSRIGQIFGKLTVIARAPDKVYSNGKKYPRWTCLCECGKETESSADNLASGHTKSCGCYRIEKPKTAFRTHGRTGTRAYRIWKAMRYRCDNRNDPDYGGRGIKVCDRWQTFENFLTDMGEPPPGMSLDRFPDNNGNYEPGNCRWATSKEQNRNRRDNVKIQIGQRILVIPEWAEISGIGKATIRARLKAGKPTQEAIFNAVKKHQH